MLGNYTNLCRWSDCTLLFPNAEQLYDHLCEDHVGRKITSNLCLACKWKDCGSSYSKRDHITSHLRGTFIAVVDYYNLLFFENAVHTQQKPYCCPLCRKSFKRIQDLRKHEKIHTEEHRVQHTRSKAPTLTDFAYIHRVWNGDDHAGASEVIIPRLRSRASSSSSDGESRHTCALSK
ncbi:hypothetical protein BDZ89DRAFT_215900 [Hymenopellis radicata]|nr:hypothetical protein BDZ89DRAFT_215900 [Hymenopellis radicata]